MIPLDTIHLPSSLQPFQPACFEWIWRPPVPTTGILNVETVQLAPDGKTYAYSVRRQLDDLYVAVGLK